MEEIYIIYAAVIFIFCYLTGSLAGLIAKRRSGFAASVTSGFVFLCFIFFIDETLLMFRFIGMNALVTLFIAELVLILILYIIFCFVRWDFTAFTDLRKAFAGLGKTLNANWWHIFYILAFLALMVYLIISAQGSSDAYEANEAAARVISITSNRDLSGTGLIFAYWEVLLSVIGTVFRISPDALCTVFMPLIVIPMHYLAVFLAANEAGRERVAPFLLMSVLFDVCTVSGMSSSGLLRAGCFAPEAVLFNIFFPLMLFFVMRAANGGKFSAFYFLCLLIAATGLTGSNVLTVTAFAFTLMISFLICVRKGGQFLKFLIPFVIAGAFQVWKIILSGTTFVVYFPPHRNNAYFNAVQAYFGNILLIVLLLIAAVIMLPRRKDDKEPGFDLKVRLMIFLNIVIIFVLFLNPFVMPYAEGYLAGSLGYASLFNLLLPSVIIPLGLSDCAARASFKPLRAVLDVLFCVIIVLLSYASALI